MTITKKYQRAAIVKYLSNIKNLLSLPHTILTQDELCCLLCIDYQGKQYYCKYYRRSGKHLRRFFGVSRVKREWLNLLYFQQLGILAPNVVAYGEQRYLGYYRQGFLMMEAVNNIMDLASMAQQQSLWLNNPIWSDTLFKKIADYTRQLHQAQFIHNDLKWRNILVKLIDEPTPYFTDCPCGKIKTGFLYRRGVIKDLACLDKKAKYYLSRTQRLRFYLRYQQANALAQQHKHHIKKIIHFFDGRE